MRIIYKGRSMRLTNLLSIYIGLLVSLGLMLQNFFLLCLPCGPRLCTRSLLRLALVFALPP